MRKNGLLLLMVCGVMLFVVGMLAAHDDDPPPDGEPHTQTEDYDFGDLTYYEHIAPIFDAHCMACHAEGQIAGSVELHDLQTVQENAGYIADTVNVRYMPPWMPSEHGVALQNERRMTDEEIATIVAWAEQGAALGDPQDAPRSNIFNQPFALPEIRQDMTFRLEEGYLPSANNNDDYRCFTFDPQFTEPTFITGYVYEPDVMEMAHHGIIYLMDGNARNAANRLDGQDGQQGWSCYNTTHLGERFEEMVGTWTPGTFPVQYPEGTGYLVMPGDFFVMQMHYNTREARVPDQSGFYLQLADGDADIQPLLTVQLTAPVEIPCPDGVDGPQCERTNAILYTAERYGDEFARRPQDLLNGCNQTLADYVGMDAANATSHCDFPVFFRATAVGVFGHMHELGKSIRIELNPGREDNVVLLDIPRWDFHWQDRYQFMEPVSTKPGDVLRMTCTWDNTLSDDPRYVVWGEGTEDEMCFGTIMVLAP